MKKKTLQKFSRLFASLVLVGAMSLGTVAPVNAAAAGEWNYGDTPRAALTVEYTMGQGVTVPDSSFRFNFAPTTAPEGMQKQNMPSINAQTVKFTNSDTYTENGTTKIYKKESNNFLADFSTALTKNADLVTGKYVYIVTQAPLTNGQSTINFANKATDNAVLSTKNYVVSIYVAQDTTTKNLYIKGIGVQEADKSGNPTGNKIDATPGTGTGKYSEMVFSNKLNAYAGGGSSTPNPSDDTTYAFLVSYKEVTGDGSKQSDKTFKYTLSVEAPNFISESETYELYTYKNGTATKLGDVAYGAEKTDITLDVGESILVKKCYAGSVAKVTETGKANWLASASAQFNATSATVSTVKRGADLLVTGTIGQKKNAVEYTNDYRDIAVTGIIVNNFPFVMMIVMAMAAFVAIVAVKSRRRMNER